MAGLLGKSANRSVYSKNYIGGISRTKCPRHFKWRTTLNSGFAVPFFFDEYVPAQTKSVDLGELVRSITPLGPTMDNSFLDVFFFFVPRRLVWDHWEEFIAGYNKEAWAQDVVYEVPKILYKIDKSISSKNKYLHSFLDYMPGAVDVVGLAEFMITNKEKTALEGYTQSNVDTYLEGIAVDACYPRSYVKIWNDWFRDENLQDELELYTGDNDEYAQDFSFDLLDPSKLPHVAKYHNRFTSALPRPIKGPDVLIPAQQFAWLATKDSAKAFGSEDAYFTDADDSVITSELLGINGDEVLAAGYSSSSGTGDFTPTDVIGGSNLGVNLQAAMGTIRQLRLATQTELLLARDARGGTRYVESLLAHFGVHNGDARLQRSEYLGSRQIPLNIMEVTNTSQADGEALGNVGGKSITKDNAHYFTYSATEHGILVGICAIRTNLSYSSGVRKIYQRFGRFDHIWPEFKHVGDVRLPTKELDTYYTLANSTLGSDWSAGDAFPDDTFGYTPYGSELREGYNFNNGLFRDTADGNLGYLAYGEFYSTGLPVLSDEYIQQSDVQIKKTLIDQKGPQFYALFDLYMEDTIPLDPTSDPGLIDHF